MNTSYLTPFDIRRSIQDANLNQIINNDASILDIMILTAEEETKSYLRQKYNLDHEFRPTSIWDVSKSYQAGDIVYVTAAAYSNASTYALNSLTLYNNNVYICITPITTPESFNASKWTLLGSNGTIYSAKYPSPPFDFSKLYNVGDKVFWDGKEFTCRIASQVPSHEVALQYRVYQNLPHYNILPTDLANGVQYWGYGVAYSIAANTTITNSKWEQKDLRDVQMVMYLIDIVLYHLHCRIAPRNIPELREKRYDAAINWLKMCANGDVTPTLPLLQPRQGNRIRFGGSIKNINSY